MITVHVKASDLRKAAGEGMDAFVQLFIDSILQNIGGELNADNIAELNADQITLLAWDILHREVMDGGFIQLIYNGYGGFIWMNPTDKAFRNWSLCEGCAELRDLYRLLNKSHALYRKNHEEIEKECSDDEFMALFERFPFFDDFDDEFVEKEELWIEEIARYIDNHIENFIVIDK
jgi:hypothetical protein